MNNTIIAGGILLAIAFSLLFTGMARHTFVRGDKFGATVLTINALVCLIAPIVIYVTWRGPK